MKNPRYDKFAYLPFYVRDWWSDPKVRALHWITRAIYLDMLFASWELGPLPDSASDIARIISWDGIHTYDQETTREGDHIHDFPIWEEIEAILAMFWQQEEGGCWINPRLERERARSHELRDKRSRSAKEANRRRWRSQSDPSRIPIGSQTDPSRIANGSRSDRKRIPSQDQEQEQGQEGSAPPARPPRKPRKLPETDHHALLDAWVTAWRTDGRGEYKIQGKDGAAAKRILALGTLQEATQRIQAVFSGKDEWQYEHASLAILASQWNELGVLATGKAAAPLQSALPGLGTSKPWGNADPESWVQRARDQLADAEAHNDAAAVKHWRAAVLSREAAVSQARVRLGNTAILESASSGAETARTPNPPSPQG